jgi:hypothetical protein
MARPKTAWRCTLSRRVRGWRGGSAYAGARSSSGAPSAAGGAAPRTSMPQVRFEFYSVFVFKKYKKTKICSKIKYFWIKKFLFIVQTHRYKDVQSLFGLHVTWCAQLFSLAEAPHLGSYTRGAIGQLRRHLLVTPCIKPFLICTAYLLVSDVKT